MFGNFNFIFERSLMTYINHNELNYEEQSVLKPFLTMRVQRIFNWSVKFRPEVPNKWFIPINIRSKFCSYDSGRLPGIKLLNCVSILCYEIKLVYNCPPKASITNKEQNYNLF